MPHVYVILTDTGTRFSRFIGCWTGRLLNHASIALDPDLDEVYSFGRLEPNNPLKAGFVREQVWGSLIRKADRHTPCAIYRCRLGRTACIRLLAELERFRFESPRYGYNLAGLLAVAAGVEWRRPYKFFCSQFVAHLFAAAGVPLSLKAPELTKPFDLESSPRLELVYRGDLREYCVSRGRFAPGAAAVSGAPLPFGPHGAPAAARAN